MLAIANVPDVVPSSTKYGERPSEERREMILACCGRYDTRIPTRMTSDKMKFVVFGSLSSRQCGEEVLGFVVNISLSMLISGRLAQTVRDYLSHVLCYDNMISQVVMYCVVEGWRTCLFAMIRNDNDDATEAAGCR